MPDDLPGSPHESGPHDQLLLQIRGAVAEYERTLIAERMRRGRQQKLRAGTMSPCAHPPYGYRSDPDHHRNPQKWRLEETEAAHGAYFFKSSWLFHQLVILLANSKSGKYTTRTGYFSFPVGNTYHFSCLKKMEHPYESRIRQQYLSVALLSRKVPIIFPIFGSSSLLILLANSKSGERYHQNKAFLSPSGECEPTLRLTMSRSTLRTWGSPAVSNLTENPKVTAISNDIRLSMTTNANNACCTYRALGRD
jgi:hypothetical protein